MSSKLLMKNQGATLKNQRPVHLHFNSSNARAQD